MASEATKIAVRGNMHMNTRVVEVTEFNFEVRWDRQGCWGHQNLNFYFPWPLSTEVYRAIALLFCQNMTCFLIFFNVAYVSYKLFLIIHTACISGAGIAGNADAGFTQFLLRNSTSLSLSHLVIYISEAGIAWITRRAALAATRGPHTQFMFQKSTVFTSYTCIVIQLEIR